MKSLTHNGVYIPHYNYIGMSVRFQGKNIPLTPLAEQLCIQFVKKFDTDYIKDSTFVYNFLYDLQNEVLPGPHVHPHTERTTLDNWDFTEIQEYIADVKAKTEEMTKEERKKATGLGKQIREKLKTLYGFAMLDGKTIPLMNWSAEPACIYMSKGKNPNRGKWKRSVTQSDITLNISERSSDVVWGDYVWKPDEMWIASWSSPLDGKMKYVWFSPSTAIRQEKEQKKFALASGLVKEMPKLESYIQRELNGKELERRRLATVVYLIKNLAIRVGDEKIAGENGTVGCTTLKVENISFGEGGLLILDFIGKDYVKWHREFIPTKEVLQNMKEFVQQAGNDFIFKGIGSEEVAKFLREVIPHLSAKVFRTYMAGQVWDETAKTNLNLNSDQTTEVMAKYLFKMTNLAVAKKLNHKKALPKEYHQKLIAKEEDMKKELAQLERLRLEQKLLHKDLPDYEAKAKRVQDAERKQGLKAEKKAIEFELMKETAEWNLGTSLASYIDPNKVVKFAEETLLEPKDVYSKGLLEKFSWALKKEEK